MKIAVTYENGNVFQHFGRTEQFKVYDIVDGKVAGVQVLSCGGIGAGAQAALAQSGIQLYGGVSGNADEAVDAFLAGNLAYQSVIQCEHHGHHGEGHQCGEEHYCGGKDGCLGNGEA